MNIDKDDIAIGSAIFSVLYSFFGVGRKVQKEVDKADANAKEIDDIKKLFVTENGDPRLISVVVCGAKQEACKALSEERHNALVSAVKIQGEKIDKIYDHLIGTGK